MADEIRANSPTIRERMSTGLQEGLEGVGVRKQIARRGAQSLMGGDSSALPFGIGIADFVPFLGTTMGLEEGAHATSDAYESAKQGNYLDAAASMAGAAAGLIPGGYSTYKTGKKMLKKIRPIELPKVKDMGDIPKKQSLKEWAMAGGGVPTSHAGRTEIWHKKARNYAAGGVVRMAQGGGAFKMKAYEPKGGVNRRTVDVPGVGPVEMFFDEPNKRIVVSDEGYWNPNSPVGEDLNKAVAWAHSNGYKAGVALTPYSSKNVIANMGIQDPSPGATDDQLRAYVDAVDFVVTDPYIDSRTLSKEAQQVLIDFTKDVGDYANSKGKDTWLYMQAFATPDIPHDNLSSFNQKLIDATKDTYSTASFFNVSDFGPKENQVGLTQLNTSPFFEYINNSDASTDSINSVITNDQLRQETQDSVALRDLNDELYAKTGQFYNTLQEAQRAKEAQAVKESQAESAAEDGGYQAPTQAEMREMARQAQALREANDARTAAAAAEAAAAAAAELAAGSGTSIQGGLDEYNNLYGSQPSHYSHPAAGALSQVTPYSQAPTQSAGYLRSIGEGGAGVNSYYDEINAYLANHSQDEIQQAMGTYGVSQADIDAAKAYSPTPATVAPPTFTPGNDLNLDSNVRDAMNAGVFAKGGEVRMAKGGSAKDAVKAGLKKLFGKADEAPKGVEPIIVRTPEERAVIDKFGQKQQQEAVRQKKVEKAAKESASKSPEESAKPAKSKGPRVKVEPDYFRKMAEEQGDEAVLRAARAGKQLKPTGEGYIGAPRTVTSGQGLGAMRKAMDADFADSVEAVRLADPERLGTWYDRAKQGIAESTEPYQLPRTLEQHGVYSAGVSPESELTFALKHLNSRVAGDPQMAYRGAGMRNLDESVAESRPANMGFKIGEYANKNDPRIPNAGLFGVNDFRRAQGMGYTDPQGNPWKAGVSDTMHPFMDAETALQVDRANTAGTGGRTDWQGPHIQEVPWVYGKAQDLYGRGKSGRYGGDELEGIKSSIKDANNTARDYMYKHAASATHEQIPGASLGHVRQALDMTPEEKIAYGQTGRFDVPAPETALNEFPEVGAGNRDSIYGALGYRQLPSVEAQGLYKNKLGEVETNPMTIARPLMDFPTGGGGGRMSPDSSRVMDTAEQFRALMDAQEAGAYNLPNTMAGVKGKNSMVFDTRAMNPNNLDDPSAGVLPTSEQLAKMGDVMGDYGFGVTATNRGAVAFPFDSGMDPKAASSAFRKTGKAMQDIFPSSQEKAITSTGYVPGVGKRSPEGPLSTAPYSGEATSDMLRAFSELPQGVAENLSESESVRAAIRAKALRDSKLGGARGDIQETRRFFSEADWPKAVAMMRKGMTPAAALTALGYNINAMAADER